MRSLLCASAKRMKYHDEQAQVAIVSVSRRPVGVFTQSST